MLRVCTRPAEPQDSEFAFQTRKAAFRPSFERSAIWDEQQERLQHARRFGSAEFAIIRHDGQDVGVLARAKTASEYRLHQLFVLPACQGRGIGSACMQLVMEEARSAGLPIRLRVLTTNERAIEFYERLGFVSTGVDAMHVAMTWSA